MNSLQIALRVLRVDRRTRTSAILTAIGVAVATGLVLLLATLPFATQNREQRAVWQGEQFYSSGSGGPAVYLAAKRGCRVTGVDINTHGVQNAIALGDARGLSERVHFEAVDAGKPLPFAAESFDVIVSNDAMGSLAAEGAADAGAGAGACEHEIAAKPAM